MKSLIYRIMARQLRKALVRKRADNIYSIRRGRHEARLISRKLARAERLANQNRPTPRAGARQCHDLAARNTNTAAPAGESRLRSILAKLSFRRLEAA